MTIYTAKQQKLTDTLNLSTNTLYITTEKLFRELFFNLYLHILAYIILLIMYLKLGNGNEISSLSE